MSLVNMKPQLVLKKSAFLSAFFIMLVGIWAYAANLNGFFILDDYPNFYGLGFIQGINSAVYYVLNAPAGERWLSYASYLLHIDAWQAGNAMPFKRMNVLIHCANTALLYIVLKKFALQATFSLNRAAIVWIVALWFIHPIHVNAVLYSVQRMTLLAGFFVLLGLWYQQTVITRFSAKGAASLMQWLLFSVGLAAITVLGVLSKENAILLPALAWFILVSSGQGAVFKPWQKLLTYASPYLALVAYLVLAQRLNFGGRNFDMYERLLSQVVILQEYVFKIMVPNGRSFALYYDGFEPVRSLWEGRFVGAFLFWVVVIASALALRKTAPYVVFGLLWFFIGHSLESTIIPLELYFDHRNYLPSVGLILIAVLGFQQLYAYAKQAKARLALLVASVAFIVVANGLYWQVSEARLWSDKMQFEKAQALKQPHSLRAMQGYVEVLFAQGKLGEATQLLENMHQRFGYYPTHIVFQAIAACLANEDEKVNHNAIVQALTALPVDRSITKAMQSMLELVQEQQCDSFTLAQFANYSQALLENSSIGSRAHDVVFLLMQAYIHEKAYPQALSSSHLLPDGQKTQDFWFLQLALAVTLEKKREAEQLYQRMLQSKQVNKVLYRKELEKLEQSIEQIPMKHGD